jgi:signal transduction histidine kinase
VKHAHASHATLRLCLEDAGAVLEVRDNGHGFAWQEVASDSYGLRMMRERAEQVGGTLEIDTQPGTGTCIRARLPARRSAP